MAVRKITYSVEYVHILNFRENYKQIIAPYFDHPELEYAIENEGTVNEGIRLVYKIEAFNFFVRKDAVSFVFEGNIAEVKKANPIIQIFFEIVEKVLKIHGYTKLVRHKIICDYVKLDEQYDIDRVSEVYLKHKVANLKQYSIIYEFVKGAKYLHCKIGNYHPRDLKTILNFLTNSSTNLDLYKANSVGEYIQVVGNEAISTVSFSKFKEFLYECESLINEFSYERITNS